MTDKSPERLAIERAMLQRLEGHPAFTFAYRQIIERALDARTEWQATRTMTGAEFTQALAQLGLKRAAAARLLGMGEKSLYDWAHGRTVVPTPVALLLASMIHHGDLPLVPKRKAAKPLDKSPERVDFP